MFDVDWLMIIDEVVQTNAEDNNNINNDFMALKKAESFEKTQPKVS